MEWLGQPISTIQLAVIITLAVISVDVLRRRICDRIGRKGHPLPPGPTSLPFVGSAFSVDFREPFRTYTNWRAKYGDIMYTKILGMDVVVLSSPSVAEELLEKRSQIYSDRPYMATTDPYGHGSDFAFMPYGEPWRFRRKIFHQTFRPESAGNFYSIQLRKARQLILNMMDDPDNYPSHYTAFSSGVTMGAVYAYDPKPRGDPMVATINKYIEASFPAMLPERGILLQTLPFLLHIPDWLPGSWLKHEARKACEMNSKMMEEPYQHILKRMESKENVGTSMLSDHITRMEKLDGPRRSEYEKALKETCTTVFMAAVETTSSTILMFTLAMVKNPRIWKRAQTEIDAVVGNDRLPEFEDRPSLPYVETILRESSRWQLPVPIVLHATTADDVYNGYYIPKGATVFGNLWAMSRDETRYPNPEEFIPERFIGKDGKLTDDIPEFAFGFGRRVCPGRFIADASLWMSIVTMLATLDFNLAQDADGKDIEFEVKFTNGIARRPVTFPCSITPRAHINKAYLEQVLSF